VNSINWNKTS